jgi:hypothetical protein
MLSSLEDGVSYVYVISAGPLLHKVGISADPEGRIYGLRTGSPNEIDLVESHLHPWPRKVERHAHDILREKQVRGEWFAVSAQEARTAVLAAIARVANDAELPPLLLGRPQRASPKREAVRCAMSAQQFKERLAALNLSQVKAAGLLGIDPRTVRRYSSGKLEVTRLVELALDSLEDRAEDLRKAGT